MVLLGNLRVLEVAKGNTVGRVSALEVRGEVLPVVVARVIALEECAVGEQRERGGGLSNDTNFITVLEVTSDT